MVEVGGTASGALMAANLMDYDRDPTRAMNLFVEKHLVSMLSPFAEHLRDMQAEVNDLRSELLQHSVNVGTNAVTIRQNSQELGNLAKETALIKASLDKMKTDLATVFELKLRANREAVEAGLKKYDDEMKSWVAQIQEVQLAMKASEIRIRCNAEKVELLEVSVVERFAKVADLSKLKDFCEDLHHCELGLSKRLEQTKILAEDTARNLEKTAFQSRNGIEELKANIASANKRIEVLEQSNSDQFITNTDLENRIDQVLQAVQELKEVVDALNADDDEFEEPTQEVVIGKLDSADFTPRLTRTNSKASIGTTMTNSESETGGIRHIMRKFKYQLKKLGEDAQEAATVLQERLQAQIDEVVTDVTRNSADITQNAEAIQGLEVLLAGVDEVVKQQVSRLIVETGLREQLKEDVGLQYEQVKDLQTLQKDAALKIGMTADELAKVIDQVKQDTGRFGLVEETLRKFQDELGIQSEDITLLARRVDLAHDYLQGVGKGLQDANRRVESGQDGMFLRKPTSSSNDFQKVRHLPSLPGSPTPSVQGIRSPIPSRPGTSMM